MFEMCTDPSPWCLKCRSATWLQLFIAWCNRSTRKGGHISMLKRCICPLVHVKWDKDWQDSQFKCVHTHTHCTNRSEQEKQAKLYKAFAPFLFTFFLIVLSLIIFTSCGWNCHSAIMRQSKLGPPIITSGQGGPLFTRNSHSGNLMSGWSSDLSKEAELPVDSQVNGLGEQPWCFSAWLCAGGYPLLPCQFNSICSVQGRAWSYILMCWRLALGVLQSEQHSSLLNHLFSFWEQGNVSYVYFWSVTTLEFVFLTVCSGRFLHVAQPDGWKQQLN